MNKNMNHGFLCAIAAYITYLSLFLGPSASWSSTVDIRNLSLFP